MDIKKILVILFALLYLSASFAFISATDVAPVDQESFADPSPVQRSIVFGDINGDDVVNRADVDYLTEYIFNNGPAPVNDADLNDDGKVNISDTVFLVNMIFAEENLLRGDANSDGVIDLNDAHFLIAYIFDGGKAPTLKEGDADGSGQITISDAVWIINYVYKDSGFIPGDANADGVITLDDAHFIIAYIFEGGPAPSPLLRADADGNGIITISDAVWIINYLYEGPTPEDNNKPVITLYDPKDGKTFEVDEDEEKEVKFTFEVEDESPIKSCSLVIDNRNAYTQNNVERNKRIIFEEDLDKGNYDWSIKCEDIYGNIGESEKRDLKIDEDNGSDGNDDDIEYNNLAYTGGNTFSGSDNLDNEQGVINLNSGSETKSTGFDFGILPIILIILIVIALIVIVLALVFR